MPHFIALVWAWFTHLAPLQLLGLNLVAIVLIWVVACYLQIARPLAEALAKLLATTLVLSLLVAFAVGNWHFYPRVLAGTLALVLFTDWVIGRCTRSSLELRPMSFSQFDEKLLGGLNNNGPRRPWRPRHPSNRISRLETATPRDPSDHIAS